MRPKLIVIGHADATGRHGIAADMRAAETLGVEPLPVITSYSLGSGDAPEAVRPVWGGTIARQLSSALDQEPEAALIGLVSRARHVRMIAQQLADRGPSASVLAPLPSDFDLVPLVNARLFAAVRRLLVPEARAVVLAAHNVKGLMERDAGGLDELREVGRSLLELGAGAAWIRAVANEARRVDVFVDQNGSGLLDYQPAEDGTEPHTSAASLAALLALGTKMREAIDRARRHAYGLDRDLHAV